MGSACYLLALSGCQLTSASAPKICVAFSGPYFRYALHIYNLIYTSINKYIIYIYYIHIYRIEYNRIIRIYPPSLSAGNNYAHMILQHTILRRFISHTYTVRTVEQVSSMRWYQSKNLRQRLQSMNVECNFLKVYPPA